MIRWNLLTTVLLIATWNNVAWSMWDTTGKQAEVAPTGTDAQAEEGSADGDTKDGGRKVGDAAAVKGSISTKDGAPSTSDGNTTDENSKTTGAPLTDFSGCGSSLLAI